MRVIVTRAAQDCNATAARLAALGHEPVLAPLARIVPVEGAWAEAFAAGLPSAIAVTSAHAFAGLPPLQAAQAAIPVYAVGGRTAAAARRAGFSEVVVAGGDARALARLLLSSAGPVAPLLYAAGTPRKPDLEDALASAGLASRVVETYRVVPEASLPDTVRDALDFTRDTGALHYSRGSAERFVRLARDAGLDAAFVALRHLCLSEDVAVPLREAGARRIMVAGEPSEAALLALLPAGA